MSIGDISNRKVLIRVDFNVPVHKGKITDLTRIRSCIPTIQYFLEKNASVILLSHFGRPNNKEKHFSLNLLITPLSTLLKTKVLFSSDIINTNKNLEFQHLKPGQVLLLENLRFYSGETTNDVDFAKLLSTYGDIYVNDAFGVSHREHASVSAIHNFFKNQKYKGLLLEQELFHLTELKNNYKKPYTIIVGGSKIGSKIHMLETFLNIADNILIGGGMAFPFIKYLGGEIGSSLCNNKELIVVKDFLRKSKNSNTNIILPIDFIVTSDIQSKKNITVSDATNIMKNQMGVDIGPKTLELFHETIKQSKYIVWNGPMGISEIDEFSLGTEKLANMIVSATNNGTYSLIGGGDTISAAVKFGIANQISYVSTGGGAMLEFFRNNDLPGVVNLKSIIK